MRARASRCWHCGGEVSSAGVLGWFLQHGEDDDQATARDGRAPKYPGSGADGLGRFNLSVTFERPKKSP